MMRAAFINRCCAILALLFLVEQVSSQDVSEPWCASAEYADTNFYDLISERMDTYQLRANDLEELRSLHTAQISRAPNGEVDILGVGSRFPGTWPAKEIHYMLCGSATDDSCTAMATSKADDFRRAARYVSELTVVSLNEIEWADRSNVDDFVLVVDEDGCAANVGYLGGFFGAWSQNKIWIGTCPVTSLKHEIGHMLGLIHEHERRDRDEFLQIDCSAVPNEDKSDYRCGSNIPLLTSLGLLISQTLITPHDLTSMMHYSLGNRIRLNKRGNELKAGFEQEYGKTIRVGQRGCLSVRDQITINTMYMD